MLAQLGQRHDALADLVARLDVTAGALDGGQSVIASLRPVTGQILPVRRGCGGEGGTGFDHGGLLRC